MQRELGNIGISVATSLAFEGFLGIHENLKINKPYPVALCDVVWINLKTLVRNINGATNKDNRINHTIEDYAAIVYSEIEVFLLYLKNSGYGNLRLGIYIPDYSQLNYFLSNPKTLDKMTDIQRNYYNFENSVCECVFRDKDMYSIPIFKIVNTLPMLTNGERLGILTHCVVDLLSVTNASTTLLIESHTGMCKPFYQWYTKLKGGSDLYRIPFTKLSLQVFGDKGGMIVPQPIALRKAIITASELGSWNQYTTRDKMVNDLRKVTKSDEFQQLLNLF